MHFCLIIEYVNSIISNYIDKSYSECTIFKKVTTKLGNLCRVANASLL